jgi:hypothetical protein
MAYDICLFQILIVTAPVTLVGLIFLADGGKAPGARARADILEVGLLPVQHGPSLEVI